MADLRTLAATLNDDGDDEKKRDVFFELARIRLDAEASGDAESIGLADDLRKRLVLVPPRPSLLSRIFMAWRFFLTILMMSWGCLVLFLCSPLRLTHPLLRLLGVPNGLLPLDLLSLLWAKSVLAAAGVHVKMVGPKASLWSSIPHGIVVYNHSSNLDPFIVVVACAGHRAPKFVGKKVLFTLPIFGWAAAALGHVPINRGDRTKSIDTLNERVASIMSKWGRSVAVSPEGTRTKDGHLVLPFKKGVFHLAQRTGAPLLPVVIRGAFDLWPSGRSFASTGVVTVRMLEAQPPPRPAADNGASAGKRSATDEARLKLQRTYVDHMSNHRGEDRAELLSLPQRLGDACFMLAALFVYLQIGRGCGMILALAGLGGGSVAVILGVATVGISFLVHHFL